MDMQHTMSCKTGGFVTIRHNDIRYLTSNLLTEVWKDLDVEPQLLPVTGETFKNRTVNTSTEARVDIKSRGFWVRGQQAFFDVRVFDLNANHFLNTAVPQCYIQNKKEKKRQYNGKVLEIDHGSFTHLPSYLVFYIYGVMRRECSTFYNRLAKKIGWQKNENHINELPEIGSEKKISFVTLKSTLLCLRGSRIDYDYRL